MKIYGRYLIDRLYVFVTVNSEEKRVLSNMMLNVVSGWVEEKVLSEDLDGGKRIQVLILSNARRVNAVLVVSSVILKDGAHF